jgi:uncharacterized protein YndB with AHSA1/START domain
MALSAPRTDTTSNAEFVISRTLDAPRQRVWRAFTEAAELAKWWGPKGFDLHVAKLDLRSGGTFLYRMRSANGQEMWGKFVYREVTAPERLVFVLSFSDADGRTTRHPMSATWPLETLNIMTFTEREGRTTLTLRSAPLNASDEERATYVQGFESMRAGFGGTFDKLATHLARA